MDKTSVMDRVWDWFIVRGNDRGMTMGVGCRYRTDEGTKCAIGCLIPDDEYDERFEDLSIGMLLAFIPELGGEKIIEDPKQVHYEALFRTIRKATEANCREDFEFLHQLQLAHDNSDNRAEFETALRGVAIMNRLQSVIE